MKKIDAKTFHNYAKGFKSFKSRHKLTDKQIEKIMTEYANTVDEQSASFFANKYGISEYEFYRIKDYTIVFMLVDATVCSRIRDKTFRNQSSKTSSGNFTTSYNHYRDLLALRKEYLKTFSNEEIIKIAKEYANSSALYDIAKEHKISIYTVQKLLAISLANHLVTNEIYQLMKFRSMAYCNQLRDFNGYTAENLWNYSHWE